MLECKAQGGDDQDLFIYPTFTAAYADIDRLFETLGPVVFCEEEDGRFRAVNGDWHCHMKEKRREEEYKRSPWVLRPLRMYENFCERQDDQRLLYASHVQFELWKNRRMFGSPKSE
jgi:hypothetical protein